MPKPTPALVDTASLGVDDYAGPQARVYRDATGVVIRLQGDVPDMLRYEACMSAGWYLHDPDTPDVLVLRMLEFDLSRGSMLERTSRAEIMARMLAPVGWHLDFNEGRPGALSYADTQGNMIVRAIIKRFFPKGPACN